MKITIYHFPECGTSTHALQIIRDAGYDPVVVDYMKTGWTKPQLQKLFGDAGMTARRALRIHKTNAKDLGLTDVGVTEVMILDAMVKFPKLVNRPLVVCENGTALCRPSEMVLDFLPKWPRGPYAGKDGSLLIDEEGNRVGS
jgi:arsenate reductase|tara:strand:+ start:967 stop:1392 length:426 start_codon:yes stop_codon:yes gene_type:complete